ncbi:unnamed protein product [Trichobilharzia regenti]|nr:unnamed protein product [Trichobilharzia regenti]
MISIGSHTISTCLLVQLAVYRCWILYSNKLKDVLKLHGRSMRRLLMISSKKRFIIYCYISAGVLGSVLCLPTFIIYHNANNEVNNHLGVHRPYQHQLKPNQSILSLTISENPIGVLQTSGLDISHNDYVRKLQSNNNNMSTKNKQQAVTTKSLSNRLRKKAREGQRVTIMLIIVVISFVITEAPQGVFNTLVAIKGECFLSTVYVPLGDILDLLVLLNSSINFILYCAMSQKFRVNFVNLLKKMMSMCCRLWCFQCHQLQRQHHLPLE